MNDIKTKNGNISDVYEVHMAKRTVTYKLPTNIAFFVYSYAKLRMLQFYYDFLYAVLPFNSFELLEMDTDSLYFALAHDTLEEAVAPEKREAYEKLKHSFLVIDEERDRRTAGLFKLEWKGDGMICLCSKTYIGFSTETDELGNEVVKDVKLSSKGLSKRTNSLSVR